jgi:tetratricopeptide (TPR) repeat protein
MSGEEPIDLDACNGREVVTALLDTRPHELAPDFGERLFRHTEGHPLFTVELLREMEERGDLVRDAEGRWTEGTGLRWDRLPPRVEATIAEGIGRLPDDCRTLLAAASVEGQEFTSEVVARALGTNERMTLQCLSSDLAERHRLVAAVGLRRLGKGRLSRYRFRHHLFQKYLYDHLDAVRRADLHEAIGSALEEVYEETPEELDALAPRLAWHFEAAGLADRAARYHLQAGQRAAFLAAHEDAISHLTRGLALLEPLPDTPERASLKLDLLVALELPVGLAHSFWDSERIQAVEQAYELAHLPALEGSPQRGTALAAVASFAMWSGDLERALQIGSQLLGLAASGGDVHQRLVAHFLMGGVRYLRGELALAQEQLEEALALYDRGSFHPQDTVFGSHAGVLGLIWQSGVLWQLGYPDQGSRVLQEALAVSEVSNHAITLAFARASAAIILYVVGRDAAAGWQQADALRRLRQVSPAMEPWADSLTGRSSSGQGQDKVSLQQMRQGLAGFRMLGGEVGQAGQLMVLAQSYARAGQVDQGLEALDEALAWMERSGVATMQAEAYRLRGELLLAGQPRRAETVAAAEESFREAIAVARQQEARWWELRAAASLVRLLQKADTAKPESRTEARQMLAAVYGWFSEGFDTRDLQEARELLEEPDEARGEGTSG